MNGKNGFARRISGVSVGFAFVTVLVLGGGFNVEAQALRGAAGGEMAVTEAQHRLTAPLKPAWVEALLDARASALRSLLEAHDLVSDPHTPQPAAALTDARAGVLAPLKPDRVEALLDARATALRSLLEAYDLETASVAFP